MYEASDWSTNAQSRSQNPVTIQGQKVQNIHDTAPPASMTDVERSVSQNEKANQND